VVNDFGHRYRQLIDKLGTSSDVTRFDRPGRSEAETLAHALLDLQESFQKFIDDQLPRLESAAPGSPEIIDTLLDIGENLRHVLYHLRDPSFFQYLGPGSNDFTE
jgi:hypothetical protein